DVRMREDCAIHAHDVFALVHRHAPPVILQVALELYAKGSVIPGAVKAAIDFARLKDETAPLAQVDDLFHVLLIGWRAHYRSQITQLRKRCRGVCTKRLPIGSAADTAAATPTWSALCFDFDLGLHRIRDETLLVRSMIHLLDFLRRRLFLAEEFQALSKCDACNGESPFGVFFHVADRFINVFIKHELLFARNGEKR